MDRISMQQVADAAGVSKNTVSLALRGSRLVKDVTREHVIETAATLGYVLNPAMSRLMSEVSLHPKKRHYSEFAFLNHFHHALDDETHPPLRAFYRGAVQQAQALGYRFREFSRPRNALEQRNRDRRIWSMGLDGVLIFPFEEGEGAVDFSQIKLPKVAIGFTWSGSGASRVACDYFGNAISLYRRARQQGYTRIGLILSTDLDRRTALRLSGGYLAAQRKEPERTPIPIVEYIPGRQKKILPEAIERGCDCLLFGSEYLPKFSRNTSCKPRTPRIGLASLNLSPEQRKMGIAGMDECCEASGRASIHILASHVQNTQALGVPDLSVRVPGMFCEGPSLPTLIRGK